MPLTPTSKLEAVNVLLRTIGESPVSTLGESSLADAYIAEQTLDEVSREVQAIGLHCNSDYNYELVKDTDGYINVPASALRVDTDPNTSSGYQDVTVRGTRLYDKRNRTYVFTSNLRCEIVWLLEFTDLPEAVRWYITVRAARNFQARMLGADSLAAYTAQEESQARALMLEHETETADHSIFDNYDIGRIIDR